MKVFIRREEMWVAVKRDGVEHACDERTLFELLETYYQDMRKSRLPVQEPGRAEVLYATSLFTKLSGWIREEAKLSVAHYTLKPFMDAVYSYPPAFVDRGSALDWFVRQLHRDYPKSLEDLNTVFEYLRHLQPGGLLATEKITLPDFTKDLWKLIERMAKEYTR